METVSENRCFGGVQGVYSHQAETTGCDMTFAVYLRLRLSTDRGTARCPACGISPA
jgi:S-formylglutathione hydrolase FrmB